MLSLSSRAYLISISRRKQVAQIQGKPIYVIQDVALIPLASQSEATTAISAAREKLHQYLDEANDGTSAETDSLADNASSSLQREDTSPGSPTTPVPGLEGTNTIEKGHKKATSVVEDVIGKRGAYGRFAEKWFSRAGWSNDKRRTLGMSSQEDVSSKTLNEETGDLTEKPVDATGALESEAFTIKEGEVQLPKDFQPSDDMSMTLLPKLLQTTRLLFSSKSFFYSHEYDLSHSLGKQPSAGTTAPLFKQFDPLVGSTLNLPSCLLSNLI